MRGYLCALINLKGHYSHLTFKVCSFMVTKHSWKGKYKVFESLTFTNLTYFANI